MNIHTELIIPAVIGVLLHIFMVKIPSLKERSLAANHPFSFKEYLKHDYPAIISAFLATFLIIVIFDELGWLPEAAIKNSKGLVATIGFSGGSLVNRWLSKTDSLLRKVIDVKSNVADGVRPPVNESNKEGAEEIKKEHISPKDL